MSRIPTFSQGSTLLQDYLLGQAYVDVDLWQGRNLLNMEYKDWLAAKERNKFFGKWGRDGIWTPPNQVGEGIVQEQPLPGRMELVHFQGVNFLKLPGRMVVELERVANQAAGNSQHGLLVVVDYWLRFLRRATGQYQEPIKCELCKPRYSHTILYGYQSLAIHLRKIHKLEAEECSQKQWRDFSEDRGYIQDGREWEKLAATIKKRLDTQYKAGSTKSPQNKPRQEDNRISRTQERKKKSETDSNPSSKRSKSDHSQKDTQPRKHSVPRKAQHYEGPPNEPPPFPDFTKRAQVKITKLQPHEFGGDLEDDLWGRHREGAESRSSWAGLNCEVPGAGEPTPDVGAIEPDIEPTPSIEGMAPDDLQSYYSTSGSQGSFNDL